MECQICQLFGLQEYCPLRSEEDIDRLVDRLEASAELLFSAGDVDTAWRLWAEADRYKEAQRLHAAWAQAQAMGKEKEYLELVKELDCPQCGGMEWTRDYHGVYVGRQLKYTAKRGEILPCVKKFLERGLQPPKEKCLRT